MKLRISLENNKVATAEFNEYKTTYGDLLQQLSNHTNMHANNMCLLVGHPPIPLEYPQDVLLTDMRLDEDTMLYVAEKHIHSISHSRRNSVSPRSSPTLAQKHCHGCRCTSDVHSAETPNNRVSTSAIFHSRSDSGSSSHSHSHSHSSSSSSTKRNGPTHVRTNDKHGYLVERRVPGDNSCLFRCILRALGRPDLTVDGLRQIVSKRVDEDPETYNEAVLEMPPNEYCSWIQQMSSWGGGIEMAVLSKEFHVEICSIDISNLRIDRFGEGRYCRRIVLLYDGSHYNYIARVSGPEAPEEFDETLFEIGFGADNDHGLLESAIELAGKLRTGDFNLSTLFG
ncbi:ubiquitin-specific protease otu1 [Coemansia sp. IMI 203386]|nr:ubiquitin-specific protease otu1 [Coemansia sp. IMI 203386]